MRVACRDAEVDHRTGESFFRLFPARSENLSAGGVALRAIEDLPPGRRVIVEVEAEDGSMLESTGVVVWLEPRRTAQLGALSRMGIAFERPVSLQIERFR